MWEYRQGTTTSTLGSSQSRQLLHDSTASLQSHGMLPMVLVASIMCTLTGSTIAGLESIRTLPLQRHHVWQMGKCHIGVGEEQQILVFNATQGNGVLADGLSCDRRRSASYASCGPVTCTQTLMPGGMMWSCCMNMNAVDMGKALSQRIFACVQGERCTCR